MRMVSEVRTKEPPRTVGGGPALPAAHSGPPRTDGRPISADPPKNRPAAVSTIGQEIVTLRLTRLTMVNRKPATRATNEKIILGIDPGTNVLGYGVLHVVGNKAEMVAMGVIDLRRCADPYLKLGRIYERVVGVIEAFLPDELAIEAPFFGKNVQSMLKLGRAQGVAIAAAISRDVPIHEYAPMKIKMSITGNGQSSKEQVAAMLKRMLNISEESLVPYLDATDALAAAYCHFLEQGRAAQLGSATGGARNWADFVKQNKNRVSRPAAPRIPTELCKNLSK